MTPPVFDNALRSRIRQRLQARQPLTTTDTPLKRAAVTVIVTSDGRGHAALVLTLRSSHLKNHANQYALPGGRLDAGETEIDAALREMREEIGLTLDEDAILGRLDDYPTRSGYLITPLVAWADENVAMVANPSEVEEIYRVPLTELALPGSPQFISGNRLG